eukprot:TRINITY_DN69647_c0_g1_i1.p1 TRINITY_DN69647_c0_g1~~TRINITY_DN69647_c0_g1_i1.p1  ORF type:complete len:748 (-),score=140.72 TRINITY_DN69647_c0_g1_i1:28-2271(-)
MLAGWRSTLLLSACLEAAADVSEHTLVSGLLDPEFKLPKWWSFVPTGLKADASNATRSGSLRRIGDSASPKDTARRKRAARLSAGRLRTLRILGSKCQRIGRIGELGGGASEKALMKGLAGRKRLQLKSVAPSGTKGPALLSYTMPDDTAESEIRTLARDAGVSYYEFAPVHTGGEQDVVHNLDLLFIDSLHDMRNVIAVLRRSAHHASKYIVIDVNSYPGGASTAGRSSGVGSLRCMVARRLAPKVPVNSTVWPVVEEFASLHKGWQLEPRRMRCNGLVVLRKHQSAAVPMAELDAAEPHCLHTFNFADRSVDFGRGWLPREAAIGARTRQLTVLAHKLPSAWHHAKLAVILLDNAQKAELARKHAKAALVLDAAQPHALLAQAQLMCPRWLDGVCVGDQDQAEGYLRTCLQAHAGLWQPRLMLGVLRLHRGDRKGGVRLLTQALKLAPTSRHVAAIVGEAFERADMPENAASVIGDAVKSGLWNHPLQQVREVFFPTVKSPEPLPADSVLPALFLQARSMLQDAWQRIRDDVLEALRKRGKGGVAGADMSPGGSMRFVQFDTGGGNFGGAGANYGDSKPTGRWEEIYLYSSEASLFHPHCPADEFPVTCALLKQLPAELGLMRAGVSVVQPPLTVIPVHQSQSQGRLRLHVPLVVPSGASSTLHLGAQGVPFEEGKSFWFDESFGHASTHRHPSEARISFYIDAPQPGLRTLKEASQKPVETEPPPFSAPFWGEALCRADVARRL